MEQNKKESSDLKDAGVVNYVLEQLAEVTTVKNERGENEELYILYPPKKSGIYLYYRFFYDQLFTSFINLPTSTSLMYYGKLSFLNVCK